jgi:hypothetical protein
VSENLKGQRHDDPPEQGLRYRVRIAVAKYPVLVGATVALIVATVALVLVLGQQNDLKTEKADNATLRRAAFGFCKRLQIERERHNRTEAVIYLTLESAADREKSLAEKDIGDRRIHKISEVTTRALAEESQYTAPTNCTRAVDAPRDYFPPQPQPYTRKLAAQVIPKGAKALADGARAIQKAAEQR